MSINIRNRFTLSSVFSEKAFIVFLNIFGNFSNVWDGRRMAGWIAKSDESPLSWQMRSTSWYGGVFLWNILINWTWFVWKVQGYWIPSTFHLGALEVGHLTTLTTCFPFCNRGSYRHHGFRVYIYGQVKLNRKTCVPLWKCFFWAFQSLLRGFTLIWHFLRGDDGWSSYFKKGLCIFHAENKHFFAHMTNRFEIYV